MRIIRRVLGPLQEGSPLARPSFNSTIYIVDPENVHVSLKNPADVSTSRRTIVIVSDRPIDPRGSGSVSSPDSASAALFPGTFHPLMTQSLSGLASSTSKRRGASQTLQPSRRRADRARLGGGISRLPRRNSKAKFSRARYGTLLLWEIKKPVSPSRRGLTLRMYVRLLGLLLPRC